MARDDRTPFLARSLRALQGNLGRAQPAIAASYTLVGAVILCGGGGYFLDARYGTDPWFLLSGLILGITAGLYQLAKTLWHR